MERVDEVNVAPGIPFVKSPPCAEEKGPRYSREAYAKASILEAHLAGLLTKAQAYEIFHRSSWKGA